MRNVVLNVLRVIHSDVDGCLSLAEYLAKHLEVWVKTSYFMTKTTEIKLKTYYMRFLLTRNSIQQFS